MLDVVRILKNQEQFEVQLAKEENREPHIYHGVFATHPDNDERLKTVIGEAQKLEDGHGPSPRGPFLHRLAGLVFGERASEGIVRGSTFYHRGLDFALQFPEAWRVENKTDQLIAVSPDQSAALQLTVRDRNKRIASEHFLRERLGFDEIRQGEHLQINGLNGYTGIVRVGAGNDTRSARLAVLYKGDRAFVFFGVPEKAGGIRTHDAGFMQTVRSLHPLTQDERKLSDSLKLSIIEARGGTTFRDLAADSLIHHHPEEQLRLLNARYPRGEPTPGQLLKTVK